MKFSILLLSLFSATAAFAAPCAIRGEFKAHGDDESYKTLTFQTKKTATLNACLAFAAKVLDRSQHKFAEKDVLLSFKNERVTLNGWSLQRLTKSVRASAKDMAGCNLYRCHYMGEGGYCDASHPADFTPEKCAMAYFGMKGSADSVGGAYRGTHYILRFKPFE